MKRETIRNKAKEENARYTHFIAYHGNNWGRDTTIKGAIKNVRKATRGWDDKFSERNIKLFMVDKESYVDDSFGALMSMPETPPIPLPLY